jgi:hypothetical protein
MLNELILGVVGENGTSFLQSCTSANVVGLPDSLLNVFCHPCTDGIAYHWDRGSYSHLHHEEDAVSTWIQFSGEGPGMSMLRQRDLPRKFG